MRAYSLFLAYLVAFGSARIATASAKNAEGLVRSVMREIGAKEVSCPADLPETGQRRMVLCAEIAMGERSFRRAWRRAVAKKGYRLDTSSRENWRSEGTSLIRNHEFDGTPVRVIWDSAGTGLVVIVSRDLDPCDAEWSGSGPLLLEQGKEAGLGYTPPEMVHRVQPGFPTELSVRGLNAKVVLEAIIRKDGTVGPTCIVSVDPPHRVFEKLAVNSVKQWRYRPPMKDGEPVAVRFKVVVIWTTD